jgi:hypothetical protein
VDLNLAGQGRQCVLVKPLKQFFQQKLIKIEGFRCPPFAFQASEGMQRCRWPEKFTRLWRAADLIKKET